MSAVAEHTDTPTEPDKLEETEEPKAFFNPPLYIQRYDKVCKLIESEHASGNLITKVVDMGCAECKLIQRMRQLPFLTHIIGVDLDADLLKEKSRHLEPLISDYLLKRDRDLVITILCGSVAEPDARLQDADMVTMVELIEHLYDDTISAMAEHLFQVIRPKVVVITTPNSEYNILFPDFSGMRHWDHKFEWDREQFAKWCSDVAERYSYTVAYDGIGDPPPTSAHLGHCSQMAVFRRLGDQSSTSTSAQSYDKILEITYPGHNLSAEEVITNEVVYRLNSLSTEFAQEAEDTSEVSVPLSVLLSECNNIPNESIDSLGDRLITLGYSLTSDRLTVVLDMTRQWEEFSESGEESPDPEDVINDTIQTEEEDWA